MGSNKPIFRDLNADDPDHEATIVESLCMNCQENVSPLFCPKTCFTKLNNSRALPGFY